MTTLSDVLKNNNAVFNGQHITITTRDMDKAATEYAYAAIICELEDLLENHSTQSYWPAIIKHRINQLKR